MNFVIFSQCFWPDTVSVAQHLSDLAEELYKKGHVITVYTSRFSYEDKSIKYLKVENHNGIIIKRLYHTHFGKKWIIGRAIDFITFNLACLFPLLLLKKHRVDILIAMPPPPLLPFLASYIAKKKRISFFYWAMDLQPELSYATKLLNEGSFIGKILNKLTKYTIINSEKIIALDDDMKNYLIKKGGNANKIFSIPVWQIMGRYFSGKRMNNPFRIENNFKDKIVIMYSGNYGNAHPIDTILDVAFNLKHDPSFLFVFVGGGTQYNKVRNFKDLMRCNNIIQLPYQPRSKIHISLASADFHIVVLNKRTVGFTHPNKIYGAMYVARPILFIGPSKSYAGEILSHNSGNLCFNEGEAKQISNALIKSKNRLKYYQLVGEKNRSYLNHHYDSKKLKKRMVDVITKK